MNAATAVGSTSAGTARRTARAPFRSPWPKWTIALDQIEARGREADALLRGRLRLRVAAQPNQRQAKAPRGRNGTGVELGRAREMRERRLPTTEALFGEGGAGEQLRIRWRNLESGLVCGEGLRVRLSHGLMVVA
ncbi:MAG TPA: hypothetical protein VFM14_03475 [Gemmatimonadales bacterium]|nr:hypothetical protein [Gemmatimonadales bacterium]